MRCSASPSSGGCRQVRSTCQLLLSSGRKAGDVHDFQLDPVGIEEEHGVVAGQVPVLLGAALDLDTLLAEPVGPLVYDRARRRFEREVVQANAIAVVRTGALDLRLAQSDRASGARDVPDRLASFALRLADAVPAEGAEQVAVEGKAALDR